MNRLRIRVELNRRKAGVPMHELVSVVEETHKFFQLLAKDVQIETERGEWHASNFDPESLNFTAEFDGAASAEQIHAFGLAFGGATSLRHDTIAQFTRIADFLEDDELVGFGFYHSDQENEPSDWRCLSRLDALRFADEIRLLSNGTGDSEKDAPLPAVMNGSVGGRRLFKDRREREALATDPAKAIREVECILSRRIALLEGELEKHACKMQALEIVPDAEQKFLKMLSAMESFWARAPERLTLDSAEPVPHGVSTFGDSTQAAAHNSTRSTAPLARSAGSRLGRGIGLAFVCAALVFAAAGSSEIARISISLRPRRAVQLSSANLPELYHAPLPPPPDLRMLVRSAMASSEASTRAQAVSESVQTRPDAAPEMVNEIALVIPPELRSIVGSEVLVKVSVGIDSSGEVKIAEVNSTRGEGAYALAPEAVRAAHGLRFRPARQGTRNVPSQTVLTFKFKPFDNALLTEGQPTQN